MNPVLSIAILLSTLPSSLNLSTTTEFATEGSSTDTSLVTTTPSNTSTLVTTEEFLTEEYGETVTEFNFTDDPINGSTTSPFTETPPHESGLSGGVIAWIVIGCLLGVSVILFLAHSYYKSLQIEDYQERPFNLSRDSTASDMPPPGDYRYPPGAPLPAIPLSTKKVDEVEKNKGVMIIDLDSLLSETKATKAPDEIDIYGNITLSDHLRGLSSFQYDLGELITPGKFALVKQATLKDVLPHEKVAAKLAKHEGLKDAVILRGKLNFLATEISEKHPNIVNFIAADVTVPMIFMDLCDGGPLSNWIQAIHFITQPIKDAMLFFSYDIARGLEHLHGLKVLHRRLNITNVLLATSQERQIAKITGFGPLEAERDSGEEDEEVPIRWLPPESLDRSPGIPRSYSEAVDMWSFGVTIWEIYSRAEQPFEGCTNAQIKEQLKRGDRLLRPRDCPKLLFESIVQPCWSFEPLIRPTANEVTVALSKLIPTENLSLVWSATKTVSQLIEIHEYENRASIKEEQASMAKDKVPSLNATMLSKDGDSNLEPYEIMKDSDKVNEAKSNNQEYSSLIKEINNPNVYQPIKKTDDINDDTYDYIAIL